MEQRPESGVVLTRVESRYGIALSGDTADPALWMQAAAEKHTSANTARMAQRLMDDFRKSALGPIALELAEDS